MGRRRKIADSPRGSDIPLGYKKGVASRLLTPSSRKKLSMIRGVFPEPLGVDMGRKKAEKEEAAKRQEKKRKKNRKLKYGY